MPDDDRQCVITQQACALRYSTTLVCCKCHHPLRPSTIACRKSEFRLSCDRRSPCPGRLFARRLARRGRRRVFVWTRDNQLKSIDYDKRVQAIRPVSRLFTACYECFAVSGEVRQDSGLGSAWPRRRELAPFGETGSAWEPRICVTAKPRAASSGAMEKSRQAFEITQNRDGYCPSREGSSWADSGRGGHGGRGSPVRRERGASLGAMK